MSNMILVFLISVMVILLVLIAIVVWCCLYVGGQADLVMHMLANEYIEDKKILG